MNKKPKPVSRPKARRPAEETMSAAPRVRKLDETMPNKRVAPKKFWSCEDPVFIAQVPDGMEDIAAMVDPMVGDATPNPGVSPKRQPWEGPITLIGPDDLHRYGRAVHATMNTVSVTWNGATHLFSRLNGEVLESPGGVMRGFSISARDQRRVIVRKAFMRPAPQFGAKGEMEEG